VRRPNLVILLSDFGNADWYVAAMKGRILSLNPEATVVDYSHDLPAHDIQRAAFLLSCAYSCFPKGAVFCCVVDPGVGGNRRAIVLETSRYFFVSPDNGLLSYVWTREERSAVYEIREAEVSSGPVSPTFHGRDVFAPAAAYLSSGLPVSRIGRRVSGLKIFRSSKPRKVRSGEVEAEVLHIDRFGNAVLNLHSDSLARLGLARRGSQLSVKAGRRKIEGLHTKYEDVAKRRFLLLTGSSGYLEIAQREGSAADSLSLSPGSKVMLYAPKPKTKSG